MVARAAAPGTPALALTDYMTLAGVARFQVACVQHGIRPLVGVELAVSEPRFGDTATPAVLPVLADNATGYARLCLRAPLPTRASANCSPMPTAHRCQPGRPRGAGGAVRRTRRRARRADRADRRAGGFDGAAAAPGRRDQAEDAARRYVEAFGAERVYVELQHARLPDSVWLMQRLVWVAETVGARCVATNGVRYATPDDY